MRKSVFVLAVILLGVFLSSAAALQKHGVLFNPGSTHSGMPLHPRLLERGIGLPANMPRLEPLLGRFVRNAEGKMVFEREGRSVLQLEEFNAIFLLVDFSDQPAVVEPSYFDSLMFGLDVDWGTLNPYNTGSLREFYRAASFDSMELVGLISGWYRAPQTYSYYVAGQNGFGSYPYNAQRLVEDVVALADSAVDFSIFDNDGDGWVEGLFVIHSGPGAEFTGSANDIWSHAWVTGPIQVDGVWVYRYSMEPEYWQSPGDMTVGVYAHEMGHSVGRLPDLYDRDGSSAGLGRWSLMAGGSWSGPSGMGGSPAMLDAWCRLQLGWAQESVIAFDTSNYVFDQVYDSGAVVVLWTNGNPGNEYFLAENRQQVGFDSFLPGAGLMIYHVDESITTQNDNEWYPGLNPAQHYLVALEQADGLWNLEHDHNRGDGGDPYPGSALNREINFRSVPDSRNYWGELTFVAVEDISDPAAVMTADLRVNASLGPLLIYESHTVDDDSSGTSRGDGDGVPDPGESIEMPVTLTNIGLGSAIGVYAVLRCDDPYITITDSVEFFGDFPPQDSVTSGDDFDFIIDRSSPLGYEVNFTLAIRDTESTEWMDDFNLIIGDIRNLPIGPDGYGYYAYDSQDGPLGHNFEWIEIDPQEGGAGTVLGFTADDQTFQVDLPFTFIYYGNLYDQISICGNGWVAMGTTSSTDYSNSAIPNPDGPPAMMAPFWEDLSPQEVGTVCTYYDGVRHRFIIEYNGVYQWTPNVPETFEIVLYDPEYWVTQTGDGEIVFQYNGVSDPTECTVGIESPDQTVGIEVLFDDVYDPHAFPLDPGIAITFTTGLVPAYGSISGLIILRGGDGEVTQTVVLAGGISTSPDSSGFYRLDSVRVGFQDVGAELAGYEIGFAGRVEVIEGQTTENIDFELYALLTPTNLMATLGGSAVTLNWESPFSGSLRKGGRLKPHDLLSLEGFDVYRNGVKIDSLIPDTTYQDTLEETDTYEYWVTAVYTGGVSDTSNHAVVDYVVGVSPDKKGAIPTSYQLCQNYPNPFNPVTTIVYGLPQYGHVTLKVYNILGQGVATLVDDYREAGYHQVGWESGGMASGIYFYRLEVKGFSGTKKMLLLR
ncbi:M6 family metalloprotease domain-containing protein [candidate division KSB1 bacterium]|nr:M6 family metalloprotease domain-containing protein [candidate division KSB1 bacterium]